MTVINGYLGIMETHQRHSIRLKEYDYSQAGGYFVTVCTHNRQMLLDTQEVQNIIRQWWNKLSERFPASKIDEFVIMPNHIHGIIFIGVTTDEPNIVGAVHEPPEHNGAIRELPLRQKRRNMLLSKIIGYFKMNTAKSINGIRKTPGLSIWQRNYYEHVIRNESELNRIREYIASNPLKWQFDRENLCRTTDTKYETEWQWLEGDL